ncbi:MAG: efflux RND transporter periplasmic adaptor subunit [Terracidiphilus sp.]|nr:efflux RND transporter periplasmic adaptor subunit [Terracidiphilus sp.]MDR3776645.1 efflux RND transporter periplasmic adaptor subunit [Terracidiphilus sp.]
MRNRVYLYPVATIALAGAILLVNLAKPKSVQGRPVLYWVDPMHPSYRSDKPGTAPDCGMELEPVYAQEAEKSLLPLGDSSAEAISIDPATLQIYGIQVAKVERNAGKGTIRVFGRIVPDQTRVYRVNLGTDGFVKETYDDAVGKHVKKNQHLAIVYSPEFLSVAGGYLSANERAPIGTGPSKENIAPSTAQGAASAQARADRLRNLGMSDSQIDEISMSRKIPENVYVVSPTDGFILSRNISPGVRFERYMDMYSIADLSHVWVLAEVLGKDAQAFRPGAKARITLPDTGENFEARVSDVLPEVDPASRILKARLEVDNPGFKLRPDMFVNVELAISMPAGLSVPADAVVDSGLSRRVYVETSDGHFEPRMVETGWRINDRVEIVKGLLEGESVVTEGTFLVDSESRLQMASNSGNAARETAVAKPAMHRSLQSKVDDPMKAGMEHSTY